MTHPRTVQRLLRLASGERAPEGFADRLEQLNPEDLEYLERVMHVWPAS